MAYTFAVQAVDDYFEDPDAIDILASYRMPTSWN